MKKGPSAPKGNTYALKFDEKRKLLYLNHLAKHGRPFGACDAAGVSMTCVKDHRKRDKEFAEAEVEAKRRYVEKLEQEADRRAVDGVPKLLTNKDGLIKERKIDPKTGKSLYVPVTEQQYSDRLLELRLKALDPATYRDNQKQQTVSDLPSVLVVPNVAASIEEWTAMAKKQMEEADKRAAESASTPTK